MKERDRVGEIEICASSCGTERERLRVTHMNKTRSNNTERKKRTQNLNQSLPKKEILFPKKEIKSILVYAGGCS